MTPYKQTKTTQNGERGNCLATCLGCLLDIPVSQVPSFEEMDKDKWAKELVSWLAGKGLAIRAVMEAPPGYAIAIGYHKCGILHAVIVRDGEFFHDPNPSNEFVETVRNYWIIEPIVAL